MEGSIASTYSAEQSANRPFESEAGFWAAMQNETADFGVGDALRQGGVLARRHLRLMLLVLAAVLAAVAAFTMLQTPRYTAFATVQVNDQSEQVLGKEFDPGGEVVPSGDTERYLNTQLEILESNSLAQRVVRRLNLANRNDFFLAMNDTPPAADASLPERTDQAAALLRNSLTTENPRNTRIIRIGISSTRSGLSAQVANAYAEQFIEANLQRRFDGSSYARDFIAGRLGEARTRLEDSERALNAYARQAGLIRTREAGAQDEDSRTTGSVTSSSLMQLNQAANEAEASRIAAEGRWRAEEATPLLSSRAVLANPTVQTLMTRRSEVEAALGMAKERYLHDHPKVLEKAAELAQVSRQLESVARQVRQSIHQDYLAAVSAEGRLQEQVRRLKGETLAEQDRSVRYGTLAREADTDRSIYDGLLQRYRELNASAGIATSNLAIVDPAQPPGAPSSPRLGFNLAAGLLAGLCLAVLAAIVRTQMDSSVRVPEDVEAKLGLPLLGAIPAAGNGSLGDALADPRSPVSEAYGSLRGQLLFATRAGLPRMMVVTSAQAKEGKSTTAHAIAAGLARQGRRILLIDADLRHPSVHVLAQVANRRGLSTLLVSKDPARTAIVPSGQDALYVLPSGPIPPSSIELLTSQRAAALLEELRGAYDAVVIDCPPVMGFADAPALAAMADGVVFVIEAGRRHRRALKTGLRRLRSVNTVVLGAVLTKLDWRHAGGLESDYYGDGAYGNGAAPAVSAR